MNQIHVYLTTDKRITLTERVCNESGLSEEVPEEQFHEVLNFFRGRLNGNKSSVYPNPSILQKITFNNYPHFKVEGFFWIPSDENVLKEEYNDAPEIIMDVLLAAFKNAKERGAEDYGYILIGFF